MGLPIQPYIQFTYVMKLHNPETCKPPPACSSMAILSGDGYIRMKFESFQQTEIVHLISGIDDDRPATSGVGAYVSAITGYTEWISNWSPAITIGWDWKLTGVQGTARLVHDGVPGSNLMFVDQHGHDYGSEQTQKLLLAWLDAFNWQTTTLRTISI
jgi:hypothetical protein